MSKTFKAFEELSTRQKRRRLNLMVENRQDDENNLEALELNQENTNDDSSNDDNDGNSASFERGNNNADGDGIDAQQNNIGGDDNGDQQLNINNDDNVVQHNNINDNIDDDDDDDDTESVSSHEEDTDEELEDQEAPAREDSEASVSENEDVDVNQQNPADLQRRALKNAFLSANINLTQGNILLKTLRQFPFNLIFLPKDSRTVVNTPTIVASRLIRNLAGGEYLHIGFKKTLIKKLESVPESFMPNTIIIDFSTDGAKVDKGSHDFWPIQYRVLNISDKRPIIAGIFQGQGKPSNPFEFLEEFLDEILEVLEEGGIIVRNQRFSLILRCFIADAPARAFILNHFGHNSSNACSKCKVEGRRCIIPGFGKTMIFHGIEHERRTNDGYENLLDEDHHKGRSPLSPFLPLVTHVPFECMHSVYLGNVEKTFLAQVDGKFGFRRLSGRKLDILNSRMIDLQLYCPSDFNRRPQEFTKFHRFKATEFHQFILYTAPAVIKNVLEEAYYNHLMILHAAMRLLVSEETSRDMYDFCEEAMKTYVSLSLDLYGEQFLSYNVHSALHLVDDVRVLGSIETFSAFGYENNLQQLRKWIRKPGLKLPQIYNG